jgi:hypothetical protein
MFYIVLLYYVIAEAERTEGYQSPSAEGRRKAYHAEVYYDEAV